MEKISPIQKICKISGRPFTVRVEDQEFYAKNDLPIPDIHPFERARKRLSFTSHTATIYKRKCDATGKELITYYPPDLPIKVFDRKYWFSDAHNPFDYGRDFDFGRPFFEQFGELLWSVPQFHSNSIGEDNCDYVLLGSQNKNCYLISGSNSEDCMYVDGRFNKACIDCVAHYCENCYECVGCLNCFNTLFSFNSFDCADSLFLEECHDCRECIMCVGLTHKSYCIKNKQLSKEEYFEEKKKYYLGSFKALQSLIKEFEEFLNEFPLRENHNVSCEDCLGDNLINSKNCYMCFNGQDSADCAYGIPYNNSQKNCFDSSVRFSENCYEVASGGNANNCIVGQELKAGGYNLDYCMGIFARSHDLFGCIGIKASEEYCIFNKKYSKDEYLILRDKIISHMKKTGEWGQFFPTYLSFFPYTDSMSYNFRPIDEEILNNSEILKADSKSLVKLNLGGEEDVYIHHRKIERVMRQNDFSLRDDIKDYNNPDMQAELLKAVLVCSKTQRPYRIQSQELAFYLKHNLPIPRESFFSRFSRWIRVAQNIDLFSRNCDECHKEIITRYSPENKRPVWCVKCFEEAEN